MNLKVQPAGKFKGANTLLFLLALLLVAPFVGCNEKKAATSPSPPVNCFDPFGTDTCRIYPRIKDNNAAWSPDGKTIAYFHPGFTFLGDTSGIYLIDTAGNHRWVLVPSVRAVEPTFSPDGQWVAFANLADGGIYKIKTNGDSATRLTFGGEDQQPAWSPEGNWIAYIRREGQGVGLRMVNSDGSQDSSFALAISSPSWSKDNSRILGIWATYEQGVFKIYAGTYNRADSTFRKLREVPTTNGTQWSYLRWSPDNTKILLTVREDGDAQYVSKVFLYTMDSTGQNLQQLLSTLSAEGTWSPDGRRIVYTDARPEYGTLFVMDADGRNKRQLTLTGLPKKSPGR